MSKNNTSVNDGTPVENKVENPIYRQDFTLSLDKTFVELLHMQDEPIAEFDLHIIIQKILGDICDDYVFQLESPKENPMNFHYQGRVNLKSGNRWRCGKFAEELRRELTHYLWEWAEERDYLCFAGDYGIELHNKRKGKKALLDMIIWRIETSPTHVSRGNFDYVLKQNSRFLGPWSNRPIFLGRSILPESLLMNYQRLLLDKLKDDKIDFRTIYHIKDEVGGNLKSSFCKYLMWHHRDEVAIINPFGTVNQINSSLCKLGIKKMYILDIPRSYSWLDTKGVRRYHDNWPELANLIELLKNGMLQDSMYGSCDKFLIMDNPVVLIFSNWNLERVRGDYFSTDRLVTIDISSGDFIGDELPVACK